MPILFLGAWGFTSTSEHKSDCANLTSSLRQQPVNECLQAAETARERRKKMVATKSKTLGPAFDGVEREREPFSHVWTTSPPNARSKSLRCTMPLREREPSGKLIGWMVQL